MFIIGLIVAIVIIIIIIVLAIPGVFRFVTCAMGKLWRGEQVTKRSTECGRELIGRFRMIENEDKCELVVKVFVKLILENSVTLAEAEAARGRWNDEIESRWSDKFKIRRVGGRCKCAEYKVLVDVVFDFNSGDHVVRVRNTGLADGDLSSREFDTTMADFKASHEFGHLLGFLDESPSADCPDRVVPADMTDSIMGNGLNVKARHYQPFADWISVCCKYEVAG